MRYAVEHDFGPVRGYEVGRSLVGKPMMTVYLWVVDHVLIDTGQRHLRREVLEFARGLDLDAVLLTHHHEDHSGNAAALARELGLPIYGHAETAARLTSSFRIRPYQHYLWGSADPVEVEVRTEPLQGRTMRFEPVHTPGHCPDHTVWWVPELGGLFSGDLYVADRIKYFREDEEFAGIMDSLRLLVERFDVDGLYCAHRPKRDGGSERLRAKLQFLEDLYGQIDELHAAGLSERQIMARVGLPEQPMVVAITGGNLSARHMVRSALRSLAPKPVAATA